MNIEKAFCHELGRSIDISQARNEYFRQDIPRTRFTFSCSSPECQGDFDVIIVGVNYDKLVTDDENYVQAHFRSKDKGSHSEDCHWVIEEEARREYINQGDSQKEKKNRHRRTTEQNYIEVSTFLSRTKSKESNTEESSKTVEKEIDTPKRKASIRSARIKKAISRIERGYTSASFSELVSNYLEISRQKLWDTPLKVEGCRATTYGQFFKKLEWYDDTKAGEHIYFGSVKVDKVYPKDFDFVEGLPSGIVLKFYQKATVGDTTSAPTLYITKKMFDESPAAHVLAESIKAACLDEDFSNYLWCHFYGRIEEVERKGRNDESYTVLSVVPDSIDTLELIPFKKDKS